jgi:hypothetical protein
MHVEGHDDQLDRVRVGTPVSIDARSIRCDDTALTHVRRHTLARLDAVAILDRHERPWYADARIVSVHALGKAWAKLID